MKVKTNTPTYGAICLQYVEQTQDLVCSICSLDAAVLPLEFAYKIDDYDKLIEFICGLKFDYIFVYDHYALFSLIDRYIVEKHLNSWSAHKKNDGKAHKVTQDCYAINDGEGAEYTRKLWLRVADSRPNVISRHKRCHAVEFINFSLMTGRRPFESVLDGFGVARRIFATVSVKVLELCDLIKAYNLVFAQITHEPYLTPRGVAAWTIGSAAKNLYLAFKFPELERKERGKEYTRRYKTDEALEEEFRATGLLNAAALYCPGQGEIIGTNNIFAKIYKYDVNSLFPSTYRDLPQLGMPVKMKEKKFFDGSKFYEYIYTFNYLCLEVKEGMPCMFHDPFKIYKGGDTSYIEITDRYSIFGNLLAAVTKYYNIVDYELAEVYRCPKFPDPAIRKYVDFIYPLKQKAKEDSKPALYALVKLFLNNLHGKFAQKSFRRDFELVKDNDGIIRKKYGEYRDEWSVKHFDFIRGAYIYSSAQAKFLTMIFTASAQNARIKNMEGYRLKDRIFYCDTDSVITDIPLFTPSETLGDFKLEGEFKQGFTIAPKIYGLSNSYDDGVLVCAGAQGDYIAEQLRARKVPFWAWSFILKQDKFKVRLRKRTKDIIIQTEEERPIYEADYNYDEI